MTIYRADLHIHSVLSPCADLEMSPVNIVKRAAELDLDIIAITDHNSTLHGPLTRRLAEERDIYSLFGAEVNTREEIHCLCLVENEQQRQLLQTFIEENIQRIPNNPDVFGYQVEVNEDEEIIQEINYLLHAALNKSIDEVSEFIYSIGGIFVPAHVDRSKYSITSQLGFVPPNLKYHALEISRNTQVADFLRLNPIKPETGFIRNSDAHFINQIGSITTELALVDLSFVSIANALMGQNGSYILPHIDS